MPKMRFLIVEGTIGTGKTAVIGRLVKKVVENIQDAASIVCLDPAVTYAPLKAEEKSGCAGMEENLVHLERIGDTLAWLADTAATYGETDQWCLIDSLHITQCLRPGVISVRQAMAFDARLKEIGAKMVFLRMDDENLWEHCVQERKKKGLIERYAHKYGTGLQELHEYVKNEQVMMEKVVAQSALETLAIDNDGVLVTAVEETFDFWIV